MTAVFAKQLVVLLFTVWYPNGEARPHVMTAQSYEVCQQNAPMVLAEIARENPATVITGGCMIQEGPPEK